MTAQELSTEEIDALRGRLRDVASSIARAEADRAQLRQEQLDQVVVALQHGESVSQAARESGLSRTWLLQATPRLPELPTTQKDPTRREAAVTRIREIREALERHEPELAEARMLRDDLIRALAPAMGRYKLPQQEVADDAGISSEWIRRLLKTK